MTDATSVSCSPFVPYAQAVRRRFEQIRPIGYQRVRKVSDGDELDLGALVDVRSDLRAGVSPDDRVYSQRQRARRDVSAAFLVDLSASTDDPVVEPGDGTSRPMTRDRRRTFAIPWFDDDDYVWERRTSSQRRSRSAHHRHSERSRRPDGHRASRLSGTSTAFTASRGTARDCVEFYVAKEFDAAFSPQGTGRHRGDEAEAQYPHGSGDPARGGKACRRRGGAQGADDRQRRIPAGLRLRTGARQPRLRMCGTRRRRWRKPNAPGSTRSA